MRRPERHYLPTCWPAPPGCARRAEVRYRSSDRTAQIIDDDEVVLDAAIATMDAVEDLDDLANVNIEAGFFFDLAPCGLHEGFAEFDDPARQRPLALSRLMRALDDECAASVDDDAANADNRPIRKLALDHHLLDFTLALEL